MDFLVPAHGHAANVEDARLPRKVLRPRALLLFWRLVHCLLILRACSFSELQAQVFTGPLGSLQTTGEVYLDGIPAAGEQSVFTGEDVHTGATGVAALTVFGTGLLNIAGQTEISLGTGQPLVTLKRGTFGARSFPGGKGLEIAFGAFLVHLPLSGAAGAITVGSDGAAKVECLDGVLVLTRLHGNQTIDLRLGQWVNIDADGKAHDVGTTVLSPAGTAGQAPRTQGAAAKHSRAIYLVLGAAATADGIGAVGAALAHKAGGQPISPSSP